MKTISDNSKIRATARGQLLGHYPLFIVSHLYAGGIIVVLSEFFRVLISPRNIVQLALFDTALFLLLLLSGLFNVGLCSLHLRLAQGKSTSFSQVMQGLFINPDKTLKTELLIALHITIRMLPCSMILALYLVLHKQYLLILAGVLFIGCFAQAVILQLNYSQIFFLLLEEPTASIREILEASTLLMTGQKMRYFKLLLSFVWLYLICILTLGIGLLWVRPYCYAAKARFHLELLKNWKTRNT